MSWDQHAIWNEADGNMAALEDRPSDVGLIFGQLPPRREFPTEGARLVIVGWIGPGRELEENKEEHFIRSSEPDKADPAALSIQADEDPDTFSRAGYPGPNVLLGSTMLMDRTAYGALYRYLIGGPEARREEVPRDRGAGSSPHQIFGVLRFGADHAFLSHAQTLAYDHATAVKHITDDADLGASEGPKAEDDDSGVLALGIAQLMLPTGSYQPERRNGRHLSHPRLMVIRGETAKQVATGIADRVNTNARGRGMQVGAMVLRVPRTKTQAPDAVDSFVFRP